VRNGIGVDEQAEIEMGGIKGLWPLRASHDATHDHVLIQTFSGATRALQFTSGSDGDGEPVDEMAPMRLPGFATDEHTLCCVNAIGDFVLQVTRSGAHLVMAATFARVATWAPPAGQRIALAAASASQLLVTTGGGRLVYLEVDVSARALVERR
jgi:DNA damage-binding protein 1